MEKLYLKDGVQKKHITVDYKNFDEFYFMNYITRLKIAYAATNHAK